jgi:hypothetical protein
MSYCTTGYAVQISALEALVGSGKEEVLKPVRKKFTRWFAPSSADSMSIGDAALELIGRGVPAKTKHPVEYRYALEVLCAAAGRVLDDEAIEEAPPDEVPLLSKLLARGAPIKLPTSRDFPVIGFAKYDEMKRLLAASSKDEELESDALVAHERLTGWLEECLESESDIVLFHY